MINTKRKSLEKLLTSQKVGVLATHGVKFPYTNLIAFVATNDLHSIIFATLRSTQKYENLRKKTNVSFLIDDRFNELTDFSQVTTVTVLGNTFEVSKNKYSELFLSKHPQLKTFLLNPYCVLFLKKKEYF